MHTSARLNQTSNLTRQSNKSRVYTSVKAKGRLLDDVCALRYDAYIANNFIEPNDTKRFFDEYDHAPHCPSYLTYCNGEVIGSIRACVYQPGSNHIVPAMEIYESEIKAEIGINQTIVESNQFVIVPEFQRRVGIRARMALVRNVVNAALEHKARTIITAVRAEYVRLYQSFSFVRISDAKLYPPFKIEAELLACCDVPAVNEFFARNAL